MSRLLLALWVTVFSLHHATAQQVRRADLKPGLVFTSVDAGGLSVSRLEPTVALNLNPGEAAHPRSDGGMKYVWAGYIQIVTAGKYKFDADLIGKLTITIDNQPVFTQTVDGNVAKSVNGGEVELKTGIQTFTATLERIGQAVRADVQWSGPRFRKEPFPNGFLLHDPKQRPATFAEDLKRDHGRFLFEEMSCVKCHAAGVDDKMAKGLAKRSGPDLSKIAERTYPGWIDAWLADPKKLRPHTTMPQVFSDDEKGRVERYAVTAYLASLGKPLAEYKQPTVYPNDLRQSVDRGAKLYLTAGCAACHGDQLTAPPTKRKLDDDEDDVPFDSSSSLYGVGTSIGAKAFYTLNHVGSKTNPMALAKWLKNPLETNPHGRMPNMKLNDSEALDIARYLCRMTDEKISPKMPDAPKLDPKQVVKNVQFKWDAQKYFGDGTLKEKWERNDVSWSFAGGVLFHMKGCAKCHNVDVESENSGFFQRQFREVGSINANALGNTPAGGCMADKPDLSKLPNYSFSADQKVALTVFLKDGLKGAGVPSPVHSAKVAFKRFNCLNCHSRDGEGGIDLPLSDKMKALENAENADDVQPPQLTGVAHKMRTSWMKEVLLNAGRARPWMTLRMPQYGSDNVGTLHEHLPLLEGTTTDDAIGMAEFTKEKVETGRALAGKEGHGCISCHDISGQRGGGTRGPDLATTNQRVRYDWYTRWMHQPQRVVRGTKMPTAFIDGKALLDQYYGGDGDKQIESLWAYFSLGPGLPLPTGLEPPKGLTVSVKDRPEILRTFMPDNAGTKCISVGYPGGLNIVFDSSQCRLSYTWAGNFLDVRPVWDGRGGSPARLLGFKFWTAPVGFPWAVTDTSTPTAIPDFEKQSSDPAFAAPLPEGKVYTGPMAVKFKGYTVDSNGNPTFKYTLTADDGKTVLLVNETPQSMKTSVANGFIRRFAVESLSSKAAWLNVGESTKRPRLLDANGTDAKFIESVSTSGLKVVMGKGGEAVQVCAASTGEWRFVQVGDRWQVLLKAVDGMGTKADLSLTIWSLPKPEPALLKELK